MNRSFVRSGRARAGLAAAVVAVTLLGAFVHRRAEPTKWAVIIGISDYVNFGNEIGGDLPGAANDARNMHEVLTARWGFPKENIRLLLNTEATQAAIKSSLTEWLPSKVQPGDMVLFYFAGHGAQKYDRSGDEEDGLDETICPTDVLRRSSKNDIPDDELGAWLRALPTKDVKVILDSCHSGTGTRGSLFARPRALDRDVERDLVAEATPPQATTRAAGAAKKPTRSGKSSSVDSPGDWVLTLSAAQADQYAMDAVFEGRNGGLPVSGGAFTTPLVQYLWQVPPGTTYEEVFRLTRQAVKKSGFAQNPQIEGPRTEALFTIESAPVTLPAVAALPPAPARPAPPAPAAPAAKASPAQGPAVQPAPPPAAPLAKDNGAVRVLALTGATAELEGGQDAGLTVGSLYQVGKAVLRVTRVQGNRATAEVVSKSTRGIIAKKDSLAVGARASLVAYAYPRTTLRVFAAELPTATRTALATALKTEQDIVLIVDPKAAADLILRPDGSQVRVLSVDGTPRHAVPAAQAASALRPLLVQELGARKLANLENPAYPFPVELAFGNEDALFKVGDPVQFRVHSGRDGYLTIVDIDAAGHASVIFPNDADGSNYVRAGQPFLLPAVGEFEIVPPLGRGVVRAFVTERPMLVPFGANADASQADVVQQALRKAAGEAPLPGTTALPVSNWGTAAVIYEIGR